ncbi:hypothetical protein SAMN04488515_2534 [Cognatiyoonia koreensis]|uniref:Uncharacterized protein n=1 Tax=Cognatiyoonia koreensis TaxID=364200 RepID=A0A1I0RDT5_9RHOB|nr:hypothetical protein [Cognatiyoonia koreensis]SEW38958.1 hypothetical protein SAMN04488515_2534 [Cognatiyoonia koreensis]
MASFIRPEVKAIAWRWREVIAAELIFVLGIWWALASTGAIKWIGWVLVVASFGLLIAGILRGRFRQSGMGPGVVKILERRVGYFGPLTGGAIDLDEAAMLELEPNAKPAPHWILSDTRGQVVEIPVNADGAEALYDAFASLPGINMQVTVDVLSRTSTERVVIWQKERRLLH